MIKFLVYFLLLAMPMIAQAASLGSELRRILANQELKGAKVGVLIVDLKTGQEFFEYNSKFVFLPASNQKLFTAMAALATWAPSHQFFTRLYRVGPIVDGVLQGDLYWVGYGDPGLRSEGLYSMATSLKNAGISKITGDLVMDDSFFHLPEKQAAGGSQAKVYMAPASASALHYNTITFEVDSGAEGKPVQVLPETPGTFIEWANQIRVGKTTNLGATRKNLALADRFTLQGSIEPSDRATITRSISRPSSYCATAFVAVLSEIGLALEGSFRQEPLPKEGIFLHEEKSASLSELLEDMGKYSNNFLAEQLLLQLGVHFLGRPGTRLKGKTVLQNFVRNQGWKDTVIDDGSGLSILNRTSPRTLVALLRKMYVDPHWPEFLAGLPIAGRDGTLRDRLMDKTVVGRVRAKTGTISGVSTLAGYGFRDDGKVLAFAILINEHSSTLGAMQQIQERIVKSMMHSELD